MPSNQTDFTSRKKGWKAKRIVFWCIIGVALIILLSNVIVVVDAGHTGVIVTGGAVSEGTFAAGFHLKAPFVQSVEQVDNRTQKIDCTGTAASKDLQTVTTEVAVNYKVLESESAILYKTVGNHYADTIIAPTIQESIKAVTAQFTAEQLITERQIVSGMIKDQLSAKINPYGLQVEIFNIVDFAFGEEFKAAVEAKQTAQQQALKAEQDLARIKIEAEQKVTQAQAEADSIKLIQDTLNASPNYIEYMKWLKWDGKLPTVMSGNGSELMVNVGGVTTPAATSSPTK